MSLPRRLRPSEEDTRAQLEQLAQSAGYASHLDATTGKPPARVISDPTERSLRYQLWRMAASRDSWRRDAFAQYDQRLQDAEKTDKLITRLREAIPNGDELPVDHECVVDAAIEVIDGLEDA